MDPVFWELHSGLDHEAPGSKADTLCALRLTGMSGPLNILDAGSGPGASSVTLLEALPDARVTALDLHQPFLDAAQERAMRSGVGERLSVLCNDMANPPVGERSVDLIWSEGAIYNLGVHQALTSWRPLLAPNAQIVFSELIWTDADPHPEARAFWKTEYPEMTDHAGVLTQVAKSGMRVKDDFLVSDEAWAAYYGPLAARADRLAASHGEAHPVLAEARAEIAIRRNHGRDFGYQFFVVDP